ncbi:MAG: hypothetical protein IT266_02295 [Saprospiraceae bacterium]|nr:hypothetical protein [Saprospiraceae bacterium]
MEFFFELLKYILPSVVVMLTAYLLIRMYIEREQRRDLARQQRELAQNSLPLKLQAYERLALFLERIRMNNLVLRFAGGESDAPGLCKMLMLGIHQEYEHNLVQQIYVSDKLWDIVELAKNESLHALDEAMTAFADRDVEALRRHLSGKVNAETSRIIDAAIDGIRKEIRLVL